MPQTAQVETVAVLRPGEPIPARELASGDAWAVFDKPPLLPTIPHPEWPSCLRERVQAQRPDFEPLHRLDEGTSGLVVFGRPGSLPPDWLAGCRKTYLALVRGITHKGGRITRPLREGPTLQSASTRFRRRQVVGGHSLLEVTLETGRRHQIRRHLAAAGHPVLGDARYGDAASNRFLAARHGLVRPFLHAALLTGPSGTLAECSLAPDLTYVLDSMLQKEPTWGEET
jgi:23S rRNA (uracil1939-C5)-methyltransferase